MVSLDRIGSVRPHPLDTEGSEPPVQTQKPEARVLPMPRGRFRRRMDETISDGDELGDRSTSSQDGRRGWQLH